MLSKVRSFGAWRRVCLALFPVLILAAGLLSGCGKGQDDALLAAVGEEEIRVSEYEMALSKIEKDELPRDDAGRPLDMAQMEGKQEFLTTMINKELMVLKATQLGYAEEPRIVAARNQMTDYEAGLAMGQAAINAPAGEVSFEEFDAFYERMGELRLCQYIVTNFESEARAARQMVLDGADWDDMADRYHGGDRPPSGILEITIPYGRFDVLFEDGVFSTPEGEISEPISTDYGWWLVRVEKVTPGTNKPDKAAAQAEILDQINRRKMMRLQKELRFSVHEKHNVVIENEALAVVWEGLPEDEIMIDPNTDKPVPQEDLASLEVPTQDLDLPFYSYDLDGEHHAFTVGDYKSHYDRMNTFQRPKKEQMVGGLRTHILQQLERALMPAEAKARGYYEDPDVQYKVKKKIEEFMVTSLYGEVVVIDEAISREELEAFWAESGDLFGAPEKRSGRLIVAADQAEAAAAREAVVGGTEWRQAVQQFGTDDINKSRSGKLGEVSSRDSGALRDVLFGLAEGEISQPFEVEDDRYLGEVRWAVVSCDRILPANPAVLDDKREEVAAAIKAQRKEDLFQSLLAEWGEEFGVTRHDENLKNVKSWKELTYVEPSGDPVPRR